MKAVLLAAGEGKRLRPLTYSRPKVMLPVGGRPLLEHAIASLKAVGVRDLAIVVGYRKESIQDHFGGGADFGVAIEYVPQEPQLGTGHALECAREFLAGEKEFLVLPGDNFITPALLEPLVQLPGAALLVAPSEHPAKYGVPRIQGGRVLSIQEKPAAPASRLVSTGIYRLPGSILPRLGRGEESLSLPDVVNDLIASGVSIAAREAPGRWLDVVYPWDLLEVSAAAVANREHVAREATVEPGARLVGPVSVGANSIIRSGSYIVGPTVIGDGCDIGPSAYVGPTTVIGERCRVGPFAVLENALVLAGAQIDAGAILRDAIVDAGARIGARVVAERGPHTWIVDGECHVVDSLSCVVGEDAVIGANCTLLPGAVIGPLARVAANKVVQHVPERGVVV